MDDEEDSSTELSDFSNFSDLSNLTETLWDTSDEEDEDCDAEDSPVVREGRTLWVHAEDRHRKAANRHRESLGMAVAAVARSRGSSNSSRR